jgi:phytoene dehydrogenase-like protein
VAKGGSQSIVRALVGLLEALGGELACDSLVAEFSDLPEADAYLFDTSPMALARLAGDRLPGGYRRRLEKYRYGSGVFKVDWALSEPVPWAAEECRDACTVHVGGGANEIYAAERDCHRGLHAEKPFVLFAQQSVIDDSRAPGGEHTGWGYCHVPARSQTDRTEAIEAQIERFAPGFRDCILDRATMNCAQFEAYNPNYVGGDIICGVQDWRQMFARPVARWNPYTTPNPAIYICSSATPPGGGVHGMCGFHAARAVLAASTRRGGDLPV